jgi:hypothetical protein
MVWNCGAKVFPALCGMDLCNLFTTHTSHVRNGKNLHQHERRWIEELRLPCVSLASSMVVFFSSHSRYKINCFLFILTSLSLAWTECSNWIGYLLSCG